MMSTALSATEYVQKPRFANAVLMLCIIVVESRFWPGLFGIAMYSPSVHWKI